MLTNPTFGAKAFALAVVLLTTPSFAAAPSAVRATAVASAADVRPKDYNVDGALAIDANSSYEFLSTTGPVRLEVGTVTNESATRTSGTVRIALFVTPGPVGHQGAYWIIASTDPGTLPPGFRFDPFVHTVPYIAPPDGTYYVHMGVFEYEPATCAAASGFCLDDYVTFANRVQVANGQIFDAGPPLAPRAVAVEYYHAGFDHYFVTSYVNEIQLLDGGSFSGWQRTGRTFNVWTSDSGGAAGVCRFFSTSFAPRSSHFYTPFADECETVRHNANWQFEAIAFFVEHPDAGGNCVAGRMPLYRLYNNGMSGAPNHRYTTSLDARFDMVSRGWIAEGWGPLGTIACVPV